MKTNHYSRYKSLARTPLVRRIGVITGSSLMRCNLKRVDCFMNLYGKKAHIPLTSTNMLEGAQQRERLLLGHLVNEVSNHTIF
ncbi:hypothetical protein SAMN05216167_12465 [Spirosoma endophyticum]|uniref:Uncharacterized protein n=1 Tax=Spirosoma endophyticum TaxID=662367 RepID=A0A1I2F673_9BACT|nr:hypothetical protein SAMN05216167_12465 [Spirosoma endophyticum]